MAVKEYNRSAPDQADPLSLELRPAHVLANTMVYLCNNILDIGTEATWGDWFDFLWNRTRAIRKVGFARYKLLFWRKSQYLYDSRNREFDAHNNLFQW